MMKFTVIPKNAIWHLAIWKIGVLVNFIIQKLKSKHLTAVFFETGAMLTPTKSRNGTNCGSGGSFQSYLTHSQGFLPFQPF